MNLGGRQESQYSECVLFYFRETFLLYQNIFFVVVINGLNSEEDEEALVLLSDTVVDPGTVVVHFADAAFTDTVDEENGGITYFMNLTFDITTVNVTFGSHRITFF